MIGHQLYKLLWLIGVLSDLNFLSQNSQIKTLEAIIVFIWKIKKSNIYTGDIYLHGCILSKLNILSQKIQLNLNKNRKSWILRKIVSHYIINDTLHLLPFTNNATKNICILNLHKITNDNILIKVCKDNEICYKIMQTPILLLDFAKIFVNIRLSTCILVTKTVSLESARRKAIILLGFLCKGRLSLWQQSLWANINNIYFEYYSPNW